MRTPDLVILDRGPHPEVISAPPILVIEVLSRDDTYSDTEQRADDYRRMGVKMVWIIDPHARTGRMYFDSVWTAAERLEVPGTEIHLELAPLFEQVYPQD